MLSKSIGTVLAGLALFTGAQQIAGGAEESEITRYSATTTNMEPDALVLRFDVLRWSDEASRSAVIDALEAEDVPASLDELPTVGYVWPEGSPVGYSVKYAHSTATESGDRLTFVTSRVLGSYDFGGWSVPGYTPAEALDYSVVELQLGSDNPTGTASLAAPVDIDAESGTVGLERDADTSVLFQDVRRLDSTR